MIEALDSIYKQLDEIKETTKGHEWLVPLDAIHNATDWITAFYVFIAHQNWQEPYVLIADDSACVMFLWSHKEKNITFYVDNHGAEWTRNYSLEYESESIGGDTGNDYDVCARLWHWHTSRHRFIVGDEVEVIQYDKDYRHVLTGKQGVIASHSVHDFVVPGYEVAIEGCSGPDEYPYIALSERSIKLVEK